MRTHVREIELHGAVVGEVVVHEANRDNVDIRILRRPTSAIRPMLSGCHLTLHSSASGRVFRLFWPQYLSPRHIRKDFFVAEYSTDIATYDSIAM